MSSQTHTYQDIVQTTSRTPLVRLRRIIPSTSATVLLKCEFFNLLSSVKDRIGRAMIEAAEQAGRISADTHVVEPTSGNTGIALAFVCASRGYRLTLVMPESMRIERRNLLKLLGANLVLTPASEGMRGAIVRALSIANEDPKAWIPQQFEDPANPAIHEKTTGPELWEATGGSIDVLVAGVGTGGTITGTTRYIRRQKPCFEAIAVEPAESALITQALTGREAQLVPHKIQGIGAGFLPKNLDLQLVTGAQTVSSDEALEWARRLAREEGIPAGISTGANIAAAARVAAAPEYRGKTIVTVAPSSGERHLSTLISDFT